MNTRMYEREVTFFRQIAPHVDVAKPRCYAAELDPDSGLAIVVLEDIRGYRAGDQVEGCNAEDAMQIIDAFGPLHVEFWGDTDRDILATAMRVDTEYVDGFSPAPEGTWRRCLEEFGYCMTEYVRDGLERYIASIRDLHRVMGARTQTLVHGDLCLYNVMFGEEEGHHDIVLVDWQRSWCRTRCRIWPTWPSTPRQPLVDAGRCLADDSRPLRRLRWATVQLLERDVLAVGTVEHEVLPTEACDPGATHRNLDLAQVGKRVAARPHHRPRGNSRAVDHHTRRAQASDHGVHAERHVNHGGARGSREPSQGEQDEQRSEGGRRQLRRSIIEALHRHVAHVAHSHQHCSFSHANRFVMSYPAASLTRSTATTEPPRPSSNLTVARPMPDPAPVTTATGLQSGAAPSDIEPA